ncbi:hypothetical protein [Streptomyces sp. NPDC018031]|uniref:hypothetical protein n=1 Tax=Streptomyces sp. NPDC018031 TaxID=3365033 RepID=UPI0037A39A82
MPIEEELGDALRRTSDSFRADGRQLVDRGLARGRTLRRRRTAAIGGALAMTLVGVGGFVLSGALSPGGDQVAGPAARSSTADGTKRPAAAPLSEQEMVDLLAARLPKGTISGREGRGTEADKGGLGAPYAKVVLDDGKGAAAVALSVSREDEALSCPDAAHVPDLRCTLKRLDDGSVFMLTQGYEYPDRRADTKLWQATLATPAGYQVLVSEWNAPAEKGADVTRTDPPLSADQLRTLARDEVWQRVADAIEDDRGPRAAAGAEQTARRDPSAGAIRKTLRRLLPEGLRITDGQSATDTGYAHVTADDGKGAGLVEVNVQRWGKDIPEELYRKATKLPDGTLVVVDRGPAEKGGSGTVAWEVDTMRPDGLRVVVNELNAAGYRRSATRAEPVVPIDELKELALSAEWRKLR